MHLRNSGDIIGIRTHDLFYACAVLWVMKPLSRDQVTLLVSCVAVKDMMNEMLVKSRRFNSPTSAAKGPRPY